MNHYALPIESVRDERSALGAACAMVALAIVAGCALAAAMWFAPRVCGSLQAFEPAADTFNDWLGFGSALVSYGAAAVALQRVRDLARWHLPARARAR